MSNQDLGEYAHLFDEEAMAAQDQLSQVELIKAAEVRSETADPRALALGQHVAKNVILSEIGAEQRAKDGSPLIIDLR